MVSLRPLSPLISATWQWGSDRRCPVQPTFSAWSSVLPPGNQGFHLRKAKGHFRNCRWDYKTTWHWNKSEWESSSSRSSVSRQAWNVWRGSKHLRLESECLGIELGISWNSIIVSKLIIRNSYLSKYTVCDVEGLPLGSSLINTSDFLEVGLYSSLAPLNSTIKCHQVNTTPQQCAYLKHWQILLTSTAGFPVTSRQR